MMTERKPWTTTHIIILGSDYRRAGELVFLSLWGQPRVHAAMSRKRSTVG